MAMIHAGVSELKASHFQLFAASKEGGTAPTHLMLFYAAECGLKCALLRSQKLTNTEQLEHVDHDLNSIIKELKISAKDVPRAPRLRLRNSRETCDSSGAHQAWRYGVRIDNADEVVKWLHKICEVVQERV